MIIVLASIDDDMPSIPDGFSIRWQATLVVKRSDPEDNPRLFRILKDRNKTHCNVRHVHFAEIKNLIVKSNS